MCEQRLFDTLARPEWSTYTLLLTTGHEDANAMLLHLGGTAFDLGNTTSVSNCNLSRCAYAGYRNGTILTTLTKSLLDQNEDSISDNNNGSPSGNGSKGLRSSFVLVASLIALHLWSLDIDDSDLHLTPVLRPSSSTRVEPSPSTPHPVRIIPGPAGIVQQAKPSGYCPNSVRIIPGPAGIKVVEDVGEDDDFKSGSWVSATNYVNANGGTVTGCLGDIKNFLKNEKLDQVVAIVKSCSLNVLGDLTMTIKYLSGTIPGTIHYKVIGDGGYEKDITVGAALILANVSVFTPKPSMHYLNITKKNVVKVFRKDTVPGSDSD
ncbi:zf-CCHC domain-containing protein [Tanacetum coccineum]